MDPRCVVEVYSAPIAQRGSGYLLAPDLVLTAWHLVKDLAGTKLRLLIPGAGGPASVGEPQDATVAWRGGSSLDLALLVPARSGATFTDLDVRARIARLEGRAAVPVDALGFPRAVIHDSSADTLHLGAMTQPWSTMRADTLILKVQSATPAKPDDWKGMSGAALFAGDRLVGVMEAVPETFSETLRAVPAAVLFDHPAAAALLEQAQVANSGTIDADDVASLPRDGDWTRLRNDYRAEVLRTFCEIDQVGMEVYGVEERRTPALEAFSGRRLRAWRAGPGR